MDENELSDIFKNLPQTEGELGGESTEGLSYGAGNPRYANFERTENRENRNYGWNNNNEY